jgi:hypothetical protein
MLRRYHNTKRGCSRQRKAAKSHPVFFERFGKIYERDQSASANIIVGVGQIVLGAGTMLEIASHPRLVIQLEPSQEVVESDESVVILCWRLIREGGSRRQRGGHLECRSARFRHIPAVVAYDTAARMRAARPHALLNSVRWRRREIDVDVVVRQKLSEMSSEECAKLEEAMGGAMNPAPSVCAYR